MQTLRKESQTNLLHPQLDREIHPVVDTGRRKTSRSLKNEPQPAKRNQRSGKPIEKIQITETTTTSFPLK